MSKVTLVMVAGGNYASPLFSGRILNVGDTVQVEEHQVDSFVEDGYYDPSNNFHPYFEVQGDAPKKAKPKAKAAAKEVDAEDAGDGEGDGSGEGDGGSEPETAPAAKGTAKANNRRRAG